MSVGDVENLFKVPRRTTYRKLAVKRLISKKFLKPTFL